MPRKIFVAGEILTAADLQSNAVDQSVMVFDDATARDTAIPSPIEGMVVYLKDTDGLLSYSGTAWVPAASGASLGAGTVLQVVQAVTTDVFSASVARGASTAATGLSVTITPRATSSRILVLFTVVIGLGNSQPTYLTLMRSASASDYRGDAAGTRQRVSSVAEQGEASGSYLDSPNTTSATTYSLDISHGNTSTSTVYVNRLIGYSDNTEVGTFASSITVMEIAG